MASVEDFRDYLQEWYLHAQRDLPWRRTRDPYAILVSEVMLQQTRVTAALPYYERFLRRFPDYQALAAAPEADVLAHWSGLGYYYRARNLQKAAQQMVQSGGFPRSYEQIRGLPGVGDYTAAAVGSIAFGLPHAVVDGNALRVLSRLENDPADISILAGKKHFQAIADERLDVRTPGQYNQALMELGATICLPQNPQCLLCPVAIDCAARQAGTQHQLPVKGKRMVMVRLDRTLLLIRRGEDILFAQRPADSSLMPGFYELPELGHLPRAIVGEQLGTVRHTITHHLYTFAVHQATVKRVPREGFRWFSVAELSAYPVSTVAKKAIAMVTG